MQVELLSLLLLNLYEVRLEIKGVVFWYQKNEALMMVVHLKTWKVKLEILVVVFSCLMHGA